ncbi:MAG: hypothetical protein D3923_09455, partial [Candidatus Electrothrix sp. AR3]|nr:hypothetical protein [Candidatus Electrothrix sp. AR3]
MDNIKKTRTIIIAVTVSNVIAFAALPVQGAKAKCKANSLGMCMLPVTDEIEPEQNIAVENNRASIVERKKNVLKHTAEKQNQTHQTQAR